MAMYAQHLDTNFKVGDTIQVTYRISKEGEKLQTQMFEGIVISIQNREQNKNFTVRKIGAGGIGVERVFPINSPVLLTVKVKSPGQVRRAVLSYLRGRVGRAATKIKEDRTRLEEMRKQEKEEKLARSTKKQAAPVVEVEAAPVETQIEETTEAASTDVSEK